MCELFTEIIRFMNLYRYIRLFSLQKQAGFTYVEKQKYCEESYVDPDNQYYVKIENDVWICDGASILAGVTIGNGAVVAANALVRRCTSICDCSRCSGKNNWKKV